MKLLEIDNIKGIEHNYNLMENWFPYHVDVTEKNYAISFRNKDTDFETHCGVKISRIANSDGKTYKVTLHYENWVETLHTFFQVSLNDFKNKTALFKVFELHFEKKKNSL